MNACSSGNCALMRSLLSYALASLPCMRPVLEMLCAAFLPADRPPLLERPARYPKNSLVYRTPRKDPIMKLSAQGHPTAMSGPDHSLLRPCTINSDPFGLKKTTIDRGLQETLSSTCRLPEKLKTPVICSQHCRHSVFREISRK